MHPFAKLLLGILFLPLAVCLFFVLLPLLILIVFLGFFFPVLRFSYNAGRFGKDPYTRQQKRADSEEHTSSQEDVCDIECTVLHSETVREETSGPEGPHKLNQ